MSTIQAKRPLLIVWLYLLFLLLNLPSLVHAQVQEIQDFLIEVTVVVRADRGEEEMHADVVDVDIQIPGYYRAVPKILYNSGDEQKNESFYLTVLSPDSTVSTPVDSNAGPFKVIPDDPGPPHTAWRDAGLFYFPGGVSTIKMHHYASIMDQYPQFLNGPINGPESVKIVDSLKIIAEPRIDGALEIRAMTPHIGTIDGEQRGFAYPGETVDYELIVRNQYQNLIRSARVYNHLSTPLTVEQFSYPPKEQNGAEIVWDLPHIEPQDSFVISFTATLPEEMPVGLTPLIDEAELVVPNDIDTTNNYAVSTIYALADSNGKRPDLMPGIEALPPVVDVTDSVRIRIQIPVYTADWDLWVYLPDGRIEKSFADHFIATTTLMPDVWYEVDEVYRPIRLISAEKEDQLIFEIRTRSILGTEASVQAVVMVRSSNYLVLDRNVFRPESEDPLGIQFKLSYRRTAQLDVYDISGRHIVKLAEDVFEGGWNTYLWNGMSHDGQKIGSGVYLVTLRSGEFNSWKKFLIVR